MRFIDEVEIFVQAGKGGNGCKSFLRERGNPKGGPDGGDGGNGGSIILLADKERNTLLDLHLQKHYRADSGKHGQGKNRHGRRGKDRVIKVPPGTLARDVESGEILADLDSAGGVFLTAEGGKGGRGNARFTTPVDRAPDYSEEGLPGEAKKIRCELKLLADVGIVGFPNAGKSTLISRVSSARPKIADYPFTTLVPQLGLVRTEDDQSFVIADIPGILPGAAEGIGLGLRFLRHIERSSVLLFLVDLAQPEQEEPYGIYTALLDELARYSPRLLEKRRILAFNKIDMPLARERMGSPELRDKSEQGELFFVSAIKGEGIRSLVENLAECVTRSKQERMDESAQR